MRTQIIETEHSINRTNPKGNRLAQTKEELKIFLNQIGFDAKKATIREFDRFYRDRNNGATVERYIESTVGWANLLQPFGIIKRKQKVSPEKLFNEFKEFMNDKPIELITRKNFVKYFINKHNVSPEKTIMQYKWHKLLIDNQINMSENKMAIFDILGKEFLVRCKIDRQPVSFNRFKAFLSERRPDLSAFSIVSQPSGWNKFMSKFGEVPNLKRKARNQDEILGILYKAYCKTNKQPTYKDVTEQGLSMSTITSQFDNFYDAISLMYERYNISHKVIKCAKPKRKNDDKVGDPLPQLNFIGLMEGPVSEQGVVGLFFKIHFALGFPTIIKGQVEFPDCYAYSTRYNRNSRVHIEFKFKSSSWRSSRKSPEIWNQLVTYLICWEHDDKTFKKICSKVEVIELKSEINKPGFVERLKDFYNCNVQENLSLPEEVLNSKTSKK